jgi:hypothetical protein
MDSKFFINGLFVFIVFIYSCDYLQYETKEVVEIDSIYLSDKNNLNNSTIDSINIDKIKSIYSKVNCNDKVDYARNLIKNFNTNLGNPDTSLCIFLYLDCDKKSDYKSNYIEYFRLYSEYENIMFLFTNLFSCMPDFKNKIHLLTKRKVEILKFSRNEVEKDYEIYGSVGCPYFEFLKEINDKTYIKYKRFDGD